MISANEVKTASGKTLLPPFAFKFVRGIPIAFIGAVLKQTPTIATPSGVEGLSFLDEAEAINKQAAYLHALGVRAMVEKAEAIFSPAPSPGVRSSPSSHSPTTS
jgi:5'-nucleotidase